MMTMFSSIYPLAPAICCGGLFFKLNGKIISLAMIYKRNTAEVAAGIGIWNTIFSVRFSFRFHSP